MIENLKPINTGRFLVDSSKIQGLTNKLENSEFEVQLLPGGVKVFLNTAIDTTPKPFREIYHKLGLNEEGAIKLFDYICSNFQDKKYSVNLKNYPALTIQ